jgi:chaperonin cofactor prefoldin
VVQELQEQQATLQLQLERLQNAVDSIRQRLDRIERELGIG